VLIDLRLHESGDVVFDVVTCILAVLEVSLHYHIELLQKRSSLVPGFNLLHLDFAVKDERLFEFFKLFPGLRFSKDVDLALVYLFRFFGKIITACYDNFRLVADCVEAGENDVCVFSALFLVFCVPLSSSRLL
jgi:phospholipid N-methyltransferase